MEQLNSSVVTSNITSSPGHPPPASRVFAGLVPAVLLSLCFLLGVPGNIAVIILRPNWQQLSSLTQSLILNLAISDLLCLLTLPLWIYTLLYGWIFGLAACKILAYLVYCCVYSCLLTVTALSAQRYMQVVHPQRCLGQVGKKRLLVLLWLVAIILCIPALVVHQLITDQHWTMCTTQYSSQDQQMAVLLAESLLGFFSFSVLAFAYIGLHRKVNQSAFFNHPRTTRLVTSIVVTFTVLWMPHFIINVVAVAAVSLKNEDLLKFCVDGANLFGALTFVNNFLNPLLYAFASRNMCTVRQTMMTFMHVHFCGRTDKLIDQQPDQQTDQQTDQRSDQRSDQQTDQQSDQQSDL